MKKVKLGLSKLTTSGLILLAQRMFASLTGNLDFPEPPALSTLQTYTTVLINDYAEAKATRSKLAYAAVRADKVTLCAYINSIGSYIEMIAAGNEAMIMSTGVEVTKASVKAPIPAMVAGVTAIFTNDPSTIMVKWKGTKYARIYDLFITTNPYTTSGWSLVGTTTKKTLLADNLVPNTRYYFRVVAINASGASTPSEYVSSMTISIVIPS